MIETASVMLLTTAIMVVLIALLCLCCRIEIMALKRMIKTEEETYKKMNKKAQELLEIINSGQDLISELDIVAVLARDAIEEENVEKEKNEK